MRRPKIVAILAMALAAMSVICACSVLSEQKQVSGEARKQIVGSARVVHQVESGTNGHISLQILLFVLDLGDVDGSIQAVEEETRRLASAGWIVNSMPSGRTDAYSEKVNATATIETLAGYLAVPTADTTDLQKRFPDPGALIVVSVEPRT